MVTGERPVGLRFPEPAFVELDERLSCFFLHGQCVKVKLYVGGRSARISDVILPKLNCSFLG